MSEAPTAGAVSSESESGSASADSPAPTAEAVLLHLVRSLVAYPDEVSVNASATGGNVRLDVEVRKDDMGRVIGRRGRVASAIRTVVAAAAARDGVTTEVEFVE